MTDREREARIRERKVLDREEFLAHVRGAVSDSHLGNPRDLKRHKTLLADHDAAQRAEIERYREALEEIAEETGTPYARIARRALNDGEDDAE